MKENISEINKYLKSKKERLKKLEEKRKTERQNHILKNKQKKDKIEEQYEERGKRFDEEQQRNLKKIEEQKKMVRIEQIKIEQSQELNKVNEQIQQYNKMKERETQQSMDEKRQEIALSNMKDDLEMSIGRFGRIFLPSEIRDIEEDIIGNHQIKERLDDIFEALKNYDTYSEDLKTAGLVPNLTALLYGPPGTGKTFLIRAFSKKYNIPMCVVHAERLISSLLGETIQKVTSVIKNAAEFSKKSGGFVLFFDEIDAIGSERSSNHEVGEIKRAVISFLQAIDDVTYDCVPLIIFGATNHEQELDSAIWRRFNFHFKFDFPNYEIRKGIIESFIKKISKIKKIIIEKTVLLNIEKEYKRLNESGPDDLDNNGILNMTKGYSGSDIERGIKVSILKVMKQGSLTFDILYDSLKSVGGTAIHIETPNSK